MPMTRRRFLARSSLLAAASTVAHRVPHLYAYGQTGAPSGSPLRTMAQDIGEGGNTMGFDMAPETNINVVNAAMKQIPVKMARGPFKPTWDSLKQNYYKVPQWFSGAKFGIFQPFRYLLSPASLWKRMVREIYVCRWRGQHAKSDEQSRQFRRLAHGQLWPIGQIWLQGLHPPNVPARRSSTPTNGQSFIRGRVQDTLFRERSTTKALRCGTAK